MKCCFSFKNSKVNESFGAKFYLKLEAKCNECGKNLIGYMKDKPVKHEYVNILFVLSNAPPNFIHTK